MDADLPHLLARPISGKELYYPSVRVAQLVIPAAIESVVGHKRCLYLLYR